MLNISSIAQYASPPTAADILQSLKKLNTIGSVLYVAAHPDDENTRLLAYLAKEKNLRTGYVSMTRGDGGQNLIGKEQGEPLGLIRTQELLAARRLDGAEQFFTRANDFGYSKNPDETFRFWNKDSVLGDLVWVIRNFKPDIIICRFPTTGEGGHGHHTASAILAVEAFSAAADPKKYPEQLAFTEVWQAKRIFFNSFNFGNINTTSEDQLKLDVGVFNPLTGKGYGEIAAESRSNHKSQGFGTARARGTMTEYFQELKGDSVSKDIFERIDQTWNRLSGTDMIKDLANLCLQHFNPLNPAASVDDLVKLYFMIDGLNDGEPEVKYWKAIKLKETASLIQSCAGLWLEAAASDYSGVPGNKINLSVQVIKRNDYQVSLNKINFFNQTDTFTSISLKQNEVYNFQHNEFIPANASWSSPYWLNEKHSPGLYTVHDRKMIGMPENDAAEKVKFDLEISGKKLQMEIPVIYKATDPVKGEVYRPFEILPPATVNIHDKLLVFADDQSRRVQFIVKANTAGVKGTIEVTTPTGWNLKLDSSSFDIEEKGGEVILEGTLSPAGNPGEGKMSAALTINGHHYTKSIQRIEYDHIPYQFILTDAEIKTERINIKIGKTEIGYIPGAGDEIPVCLKQLGYHVTVLTDDLLSNDDLSKYNAIVTGVRVYNTNDRMQVHYQKLMDYIKNGGNLIVQYNTNSRLGPVQAKIGPYPFTISRDRVTDENAEVTILKKDNIAFNFPNKIEHADFDSWVQERGIYFATEIDPHYEALLTMHDPGEKDLNGSLITAKYGKGNFVYTGLDFFRELPAGVSGAYRLFVNLLSLPPSR